MRHIARVCALVLLFALADAPHHMAKPQSPAPSAQWLATVEAGIARAEYAISGTEPQAPNRAHDLRIYFEANGVRVVPRVATSQSWSWQLSLAGYGRESALRAPGRARRAAHGNRMEYRRGDLIEWYVNDEQGLEQGFTLARAPVGSGPLAFDVTVAGTLQARPNPQGTEISFEDPQGAPVVRYAGLRAQDARGRELAARFASTSERKIRIEVDADDAVYPITIDPLATSASWHVEGNFTSAQLGLSVATAGDVNGDGFSDILVGASYFNSLVPNNGQVTLYYGAANGPSTIPAWSAQGDTNSISFGHPVATAGDVNGDGYSDILIGDNEHTVNGIADVGAVFVFYGSASGLGANGTPANADVVLTGILHDDFFGGSVASAGDVNGDGYADVVVGSPNKAVNGGANAGEVKLFLGSRNGLSTTASRIIDGTAGDLFGHSVATAGDVNADGYSDLIIGAPLATNTASKEGLAYVYYGPDLADANRTRLAWGSGNALFGYSVSTAGDIDGDGYADVIVGSPGFDSTSTGDNGSVQVYRGASNGVIAQVAWRSVAAPFGGQLGYSVSTAGDVNADGYADVIAGWPYYSNGQTREGAVLGWFGSATGLGPVGTNGLEDWKVESNSAEAKLGYSVAIAGDVNGDGKSDVVVGEPLYTNGNTNEGGANLYLGTDLRLATPADWQLPSGVIAQLGASVAGGGDWNGDGYADVAVSAPQYDAGMAYEGTVWAFYGGPNGISDSPSWAVVGDQYKGTVGTSIANAGDVNGDGFDDLIVGAAGYSSSSSLAQGRAFLFVGGPLGLPGGLSATLANASWHAETSQNNASLGQSVASAGDVNGDGYADVLVGAPRFTNGESQEGTAFLWLGSASGLGATGDPTNADWKAEPNKIGAFFGTSVASAGDVNADGYSDIIIGAPGYDSTYAQGGGAFIWNGSASGLGANGTPANADKYFIGASTDDNLGNSVGSAGDMNGDGYSEIIIGEPGRTAGAGFTTIYRGSANGVSVLFAGFGHGAGYHDGTSVGPAGDINGDGFADAFSTAPNYAVAQANEGALYIIYGRSNGATITTIETNVVGAQLRNACGAGDVNGDGYADMIVGLPQYNSNAGAAWLFYGGGGKGRDLHLRQQRVLSALQVPHLGRSDLDRAFMIDHFSFSPFGRGRLRPEYEVKALGTAFNGSGLSLPMPGYDDMARLDPTKSQIGDIQNLAANTPYHWRMRFRYDISQQPFQPFSPWFTQANNGATEEDLRTGATAVTSADPMLSVGIRFESGTPNPFIQATTFRFYLPTAMPVHLAIYDVRGRLVRELMRTPSVPSGWHSIVWDGADTGGRRANSGAYFARFESAGSTLSREVVLER
jgi:hypothetical protein